MAPAGNELLMNIVDPKIVKMVTRFRAAIPIQERLAVTLRFWATGDSYNVCNIFSKFLNKQCQTVTAVCEAIVEALIENIKGRKNCVLCKANCLEHKIDGLKH
jgi:hypothetical protein